VPVVHLVRHGQASFGSEDYDRLSELGREQSLVVGAALAARGLRSPVVVSGTLRRQRDTAALAVASLAEPVPAVSGPSASGPSVALDGRWDEYDHLGLLKRYAPGRTATDSREMQVLLDAALEAWIDDPAGDWAAFSGGAVAALAALDLPAGRHAVVFTSGGVIAAVCGHLLGLGTAGVVALNRVAVNGAITKLAIGSRGTTLVTFNEHAHLDATSTTYR